MQGMSLFLEITAGTATILAHDPRLVMLKPSLIYVAVGILMLRPGWMVRYLPEDAVALVTDAAAAFGYVWAGLMFVSAGVNLYAGLHMSPVAWAGFMSTSDILISEPTASSQSSSCSRSVTSPSAPSAGAVMA